MVSGAFVFDEIEATTGKIVATTHSPLTLRYVFRYEMEHLFALSGFRVEMLFGDFKRGPFRAGGEQIWVARRRSETPPRATLSRRFRDAEMVEPGRLDLER